MIRIQIVSHALCLATSLTAFFSGATAGTLNQPDPVEQARQAAHSTHCAARRLHAENAIAEANLTLAKAQSHHDLRVARAEQAFSKKQANPGGPSDMDTAQFRVDAMGAAARLDAAEVAHADALAAIRSSLVASGCET